MSHHSNHRPQWLYVSLVLIIAAVAVSLVRPALRLAAAPLRVPTPEAGRAVPDGSTAHVPGELLIGLRDLTPARLSVFESETGLRVLRTIPQLGMVVVSTGTADGEILVASAAGLATRADVAWAEPNYTFELDATPNDPYYVGYQSAYLNRMEMPTAWDFTTGRSSVIVAILDTGVQLDHPDLAEGIWTNPLEIPDNGIDDDNNGFVDDVHGWNFAQNSAVVADDHGHGTHVSGIAAARINNGTGIAGMAGGATIMPVKVFPPPPNVIGTYEDLILAIIYATDNGARVINMSLGATSYSRGEEAAVNYAWAHGAVIVAAAGNSGANQYHYPAAHLNAIAVAATTASDSRAGFSNFGDFIDVAAPGSYVYSTMRFNSYGFMSGTSMASPHVAGLAALLFSQNPQLTNVEVRALIEQNTDDLGGQGWDPYFGYGRINGRKALAAVQPSPQPSPTPTPHPPLSEWPAGCVDVISDGDFETGLAGWQASGGWTVDTTRAYSGTQAAHFTGGLNASGILTRTLTLTKSARQMIGDASPEATLWFAFRIEDQDRGAGSTPQMPYDDWLTTEFRTVEGKLISSLLRTGNSADTANSGLPWDRYLYRMQPADFAPVAAFGAVNLVFVANNDGDALPTHFWVDAVRLCMTGSAPPIGSVRYLPLILGSSGAFDPTR